MDKKNDLERDKYNDRDYACVVAWDISLGVWDQGEIIRPLFLFPPILCHIMASEWWVGGSASASTLYIKSHFCHLGCNPTI